MNSCNQIEKMPHQQPAPGRSHRRGLTLVQLMNMFPDEDAAHNWFESVRWPDGDAICPRCKGTNTYSGTHKTMPYRCRPCNRTFSVKSGTAIESSRVSLRHWVIAIYLEVTSLKGISSMKLHRDLGVTQRTAWFMLHRIREGLIPEYGIALEGPGEADETYVGGLEKNKHASKKLHAGRGTVGKVAVAGIKDRATGQIVANVVEHTDKETLQGFVTDNTASGAEVYTDEALAYKGIPREHKTVNHSVGKWIDGMAHTNGLESFWASLKRAYHGVYHRMSPKHLDRYVKQFAEKSNIRDLDTADQMTHLVAALAGRRVMYKDLTG